MLICLFGFVIMTELCTFSFGQFYADRTPYLDRLGRFPLARAVGLDRAMPDLDPPTRAWPCQLGHALDSLNADRILCMILGPFLLDIFPPVSDKTGGKPFGQFCRYFQI